MDIDTKSTGNVTNLDEDITEHLDLQESFDYALTDNLIEYSGDEMITEELDSSAKDFEDEIEKVVIETSASEKTTPTTSSIVTKKITTTNVITTPTTTSTIPIKIAAKPTSTVGLTKVAAVKSGGQIVIIQTPGGNQQPIRIASGTTNTNADGIKFLKTSDGNIIQIKSKSTISGNTSNTATVKKIIQQVPTSVSSSMGKLIYKGIAVKGNEQQILLSTAPTKVPATIVTSANGTTTSKTKTISITNVAQQLGLLASGKIKQIRVAQKGADGSTTQTVKHLQKILPAPPISPTTPSPQTLTNAIKKVTPIQPKLPTQLLKTGIPIGKKIPIQPGMIKFSGTSGSQIQQINIPGKGMQYVRFKTITPTSGSSGNSLIAGNKVICASKIVSTSTASPVTSSPITSTGTNQQKIVIQGKSGQTVHLIQQTPTSTTGPTRIVTLKQQNNNNTSNNNNNNQGNVIQLKQIPQRKIFPLSKIQTEDNKKVIAVVKSEKDSATTARKVTTLTSAQLGQIQGTSLLTNKGSSQQIYVLPSNFVQQLHQKSTAGTIKKIDIVPQLPIKEEMEEEQNEENEEQQTDNTNNSNTDLLRKKPCNCTRSQCLKLYCDCFANGEFCSGCNCKECYNNLDYESERQKAIRVCLERNPNAFRPKIVKAKDKDQALRRHNKGCNCKRSGCLKNYCECYEAKISCSANCKCIGCRNNEEFVDRMDLSNNSSDKLTTVSRKMKQSMDSIDKLDLPPSKQPYNFMTPDVIDATVQCMVAQAEECQNKFYKAEFAEKLILEEFGRCLIEIIDFSIRNTDNE